MFANSKDVADYFGKKHYDVLKDIDRISQQEDFPGGWFRRIDVKHPAINGTIRTFDMTRDGFTLLVMGYTGKKGVRPDIGAHPL